MKPKRITRPLDGVLLLDKALGLTSNAALQQVRRLYEAATAGHTGTLDPLASGLLPVCFGEATKFSFGLLEADKEYEALVRLGERTTTGDAEGEVIKASTVTVSQESVERALVHFRGVISQVPPIPFAPVVETLAPSRRMVPLPEVSMNPPPPIAVIVPWTSASPSAHTTTLPPVPAPRESA